MRTYRYCTLHTFVHTDFVDFHFPCQHPLLPNFGYHPNSARPPTTWQWRSAHRYDLTIGMVWASESLKVHPSVCTEQLENLEFSCDFHVLFILTSLVLLYYIPTINSISGIPHHRRWSLDVPSIPSQGRSSFATITPLQTCRQYIYELVWIWCIQVPLREWKVDMNEETNRRHDCSWKWDTACSMHYTNIFEQQNSESDMIFHEINSPT